MGASLSDLIILFGNKDYCPPKSSGFTYAYSIGTGLVRGAQAVAVNDSQRLRTIALETRDEYSRWVYSLNDIYLRRKLTYRGLSLFLVSDCSCKRTELFDTYNSICNLLLLQEIMSEISPKQIITVGADRNFFEGLVSISQGVPIKRVNETIIGNNCVIHSGAIVGADGFGFSPGEDGKYSKVPQIGNVIIEDNVDIGAGTTIDRATLGSTIIREGVKLDNQIQIAHNVEIGSNTAIAAQTGIAGSTKIGKNCLIGGQVGIVGHLQIGDRVKIQAQAGIGRNVKDDEMLQGSPAFGYGDFNKSYVHFKNLPKTIDTLNQLEKKIKNGI